MPTPNKANWADPQMRAMLETQPTAQIIATLAERGITISPSAISAARRVRGIPGPQGHGGRRIGSGRPTALNKAPSHPARSPG